MSGGVEGKRRRGGAPLLLYPSSPLLLYSSAPLHPRCRLLLKKLRSSVDHSKALTFYIALRAAPRLCCDHRKIATILDRKGKPRMVRKTGPFESDRCFQKCGSQ